jgi:hypothetical protein
VQRDIIGWMVDEPIDGVGPRGVRDQSAARAIIPSMTDEAPSEGESGDGPHVRLEESASDWGLVAASAAGARDIRVLLAPGLRKSRVARRAA